MNTPISRSRISSISVKPASKQPRGAGSIKLVRLLSLVSAFLIAPYLACIQSTVGGNNQDSAIGLGAHPDAKRIRAKQSARVTWTYNDPIFVLVYMVFHSVAESAVLIFPTLYALTGGLILQKLLGYNFSVAVWVGYIALFGIAVETGVVMAVYLHEALNRRLATGKPQKHEDIEEAVIEGAVHRLRPKLMNVCVVLASLIPILWKSGIGSDVMKPTAAPLVGGMITSTIHVLILVPVFFALMKERALRAGTLSIRTGTE